MIYFNKQKRLSFNYFKDYLYIMDLHSFDFLFENKYYYYSICMNTAKMVITAKDSNYLLVSTVI